MCDRLTLLDGTELSTLGELVDHGIMNEADLPEPWAGLDPRKHCLCKIPSDLGDFLLTTNRLWKRGAWGYDERDAEGRSYWTHGVMEDAARSGPRFRYLIANPDYPYHKQEAQ